MRYKVPVLLATAFIVYLFFGSCALYFVKDDQSQILFEDRQAFNKKMISMLKLELKKNTILDRMGPPDITEAKEISSGTSQILFYRTQQSREDGYTTQDECTGLLFINNKLVAWGKGAYQQYAQLN